MNSKPTVLVVDDVELNRAFLNDMLKDEYHIYRSNRRAAGRQSFGTMQAAN